MIKFLRTKVERQYIAQNEYPVSGFIPYINHFNDTTVYTRNNQLVQVVKVGGFSFETADDEDLDIKKSIRNLLFKGMGDNNIALYFHIIRKEHQAYPEGYYNIDMPEGFASYLDQKWCKRHRTRRAYVNELYISIIRKGISSKSSVFDKLFSFISASDGKEWYKPLWEAYEQLEEATGRVVNSLREYNTRVLGIERVGDKHYSELAEFFAKIVNCGQESKILFTPYNMNSTIGGQRLYFGSRAIEAKLQNGKSKFAGIVSVKEYGPKTWAGMLDSFLRMPFEFVITQSFQFANRQASINRMQLQQNRMIQAGDKAVSQIMEISEALDKAMGGEIAFGTHHLTVMCLADSPKELENILSMSAVELTNTGGIGVREKINMEPAFWAQLPGNFDFIVRSSTINTMNLASFNSLHNYPTGKPKKNHWGDAVTVLDTTSGTPYYFNFHLRDVGHTTIIGPTGAGKTVMMNFLCAQAQKFKCRLFFFDKDRGAEIFIRALNGHYTVIDPAQACNFNPLLLPDTGENRTFLLDWLKQLVSVNGEVITAEDIAALNTAINGNYKLDKSNRGLSNIAPFLGLEGPGSLASRMTMWHSGGSHAKIFDNPTDTIDFDEANIFGFEMAELLKDKTSLGPVLSYIFHKINLSLDGTPSMIVLDEAWALIDNPIFAPKIKDWLKVLRKLNTFVIFATQSVEDASRSAISDTLIQQTATQIFLPNLKATEVYKTAFMLSEREYQLIKTTDPGSRFFLVKQGNNAVVARIDLSSMPDIINVLSGRADTVIVLDEVRKECGDDPNVWLPKFNSRLKELKE
ncbi:MAG: VirB4 family type IV secretion/conjugal transfer ATPase [Candidatus Midichloria sp.]|uniref:VirB4 family type IV secretion/conjugal transfer ATPase n=1 Tax=Hyalomma marginatum TaxID=34627 RepID=A0A8S4C3T8_9ACAR|nr:VirB4 family type IV secretion/conjugal transfer ATPase [Hyalomma marginatum]CAG7598804.1 VirB4 family type IV secretion/conjugal transfer ATPase [Hyalomma marginatum]